MPPRGSAPRPKRDGEKFARTHYQSDEGPASKKPRFDVRNPSALAPEAPEEDTILELDEIGKGGHQTKRNAVNIDGYDSDSSNEGFDARADARAEASKREGKQRESSRQEEENDMFADLEEEFKDGDDDEEVSREGRKGKKAVRFLEEHEIEGQDMTSRGGGHVWAGTFLNGNEPGKGKQPAREVNSESEDEGSEDDEDVDEEVGAGGKKIHAPKLSSFNMREELEEGRFDDQGNFVRRAADPDAVHDTWLQGISKKDLKRAREAEEKRIEERRQRNLADDQILTSDVLKTLITSLDKAETVLEALARLAKTKEKKKWQTKNNNRKRAAEAMDVDTGMPAEDASETKRRETVEAITGAADHLLTKGQTDIYEDTREMLIRQYRRETGEAWADPPQADLETAEGNGSSDTRQWEYRWTDARDGGEPHGPYDGSMMAQWQQAGFFAEGVEFRRIGVPDDWSRVVDFV